MADPARPAGPAFLNDGLKALIAASCLRHLKPKGSWLSSAADFAVFIFFAVITVPAMSALGGVAIRHDWGDRSGRPGRDGSWAMPWRTSFWLRSSSRWPRRRPSPGARPPREDPGSDRSSGSAPRRPRRFGGLGVRRGDFRSDPALLKVLPFPFLLWAAARFGVPGTSGALSLFAFSNVWVVAHSPAPGGLRAEVLALQLFLSVVGSSLLFVAVVLDERRHVQGFSGRPRGGWCRPRRCPCSCRRTWDWMDDGCRFRGGWPICSVQAPRPSRDSVARSHSPGGPRPRAAGARQARPRRDLLVPDGETISEG